MTQKTDEQRAEAAFPSPVITDIGYKNMRIGYATCIREQVEPLEAEVVSLRALAQELVDAIEPDDCHHPYCAWVCNVNNVCDCHMAALAAAKEHGIVPTNTAEG